MTGRRVRQWRKAEARLSVLAPCTCGAEEGHQDDDVMVIRCHDMDCAFLSSVVALRKSGVCPQCGWLLRRATFWDPHTACVVRKEWCQKGCSHGMEWVAPQDATQAERDYLGLVLVEANHE
jgi:hypothetical protein